MSKLAFLVMPLWQGSSSSRAMQLIDGADALRGDLPPSARHEVAVPLEAGDALGTPVARLSSVLQAHASAREVLAGLNGSHVGVTVGGDCTSVLPGLGTAIEQHGTDALTVLWFDAHADMQHPSTSPTGAAASMALRHALGDGTDDLRFQTPVPDTAVKLIGSRLLDEEEAAEVQRRGIDVLDHRDESEGPIAERVRSVLAERASSRVYIHVDLDVLDPAEFSSVSAPAPFGLTVPQLTDSIRAALSVSSLAGAAICGFQPHSELAAGEHLPTVLRILGALASGSRAPAGSE